MIFYLILSLQFLQGIFRQMEIYSSEEDSLKAYNLLFCRCHFGFVSSLNLENLKFFSVENQERLGKINIKFNINAIKKLPHNHSLHFILMTDYRQILAIPYLLRNQNNTVQVITTKSMLHSAQIYAQDFYRRVKKMDQVVKQPTFEQQSIIYDNYDIEFNRSFQQWVGIFSKQELDQCLLKCIGLNYGQRYLTETGVEITPYPSGETIGSAAWLLQNIQTKENVLWVQGMAHHSWRACKQFQIDNIHQKINTVVLAEGTLNRLEEQSQDQIQCQSFLDILFQRLTRSHNSKLVLKDFLLICDIINVLVYKFKEKFKKVLVTGLSATKMITYANSYVQFLTENHRNRIYEDPPVYPFQSFEDLKQKMLNEGSNLEEIADHLKIPVKELLLRSTPYIHFQSDFHAFLQEGMNATVENIMETCINVKKLNHWLNNSQIGKVILFSTLNGGSGSDQLLKKIKQKVQRQVQLVEIGNKVSQPVLSNGLFVTAEGQFGKYVSKFTKQSGWLKVQPVFRHFRLIQTNWIHKIALELEKAGIQVGLSEENKNLKTQNTEIRFLQQKIMILSDSEYELRIIDQTFQKVSKIIMFQ